jgi:O-antigen/teichoic acid export membrane protein
MPGRQNGKNPTVTASDRNYTALMLLAIGLGLAFLLNALDVPPVLAIGVAVAFAIGAVFAFMRRRRRRLT